MSLVSSVFFAMLIPLIIWGALRQPSVKPIDPKYVLPPKPQFKSKRKVKAKKPELDETQKAAKTQLQSFGFSATEAKKMLEGIRASTIEQYVQEAMKRVKI